MAQEEGFEPFGKSSIIRFYNTFDYKLTTL